MLPGRRISFATLSLAIGIICAATIASAGPVSSTTAGGLWSEPSTWLGGVVPGGDDDVVIAGPVTVAASTPCRSLSVLAAGDVRSAWSAPNVTLAVSGAVANAGVITENAFNFGVEVGGDLYNDGTWDNGRTTITGAADRDLSHAPGAGFATDLGFGAAAAGDVIVTAPLTCSGIVDMTGGRMVLQPGVTFTLEATSFRGGLLAQGNEMHFVSGSYLQACTIDDAVLVGDVEATHAVVFTTRVAVMGSLQNGSGGGGATVEGDLVNHGTIRNDNYGFTVTVTGDIENFGTFTNPQLVLQGVDVTHRLTMGPGAVLGTPVFLPEFQASTLVAGTPVTFGDGLFLGIGTLRLEPGASLRFGPYSSLGSGTVEANGNTIATDDFNSALSDVTIDGGVFGDYVAVHGDILCTGGLTVAGIVESWPWQAADLAVEGLLRNEGEIRDGDHPVRIAVLGDLENLGSFTNERITLAGTVDQAVGAGPGIAASFVLESGLVAASYQWYRDGAPLPGELAADLAFPSVGPAEYGLYRCEGDGDWSRDIVIDELLTSTDVPGAARAFALEQNHPNPFNPATEFAFRLDREMAVSLVVYDIAGREVDRLLEREMGAGRHQVTWQPRDMPSGTYFYRLRAGGGVAVGKCALLK